MFQPILIRRSVSYLNLSSISMRLISQLLRLDSFAVSTKSNEKQFRRALIHCAAVLFVLICCICAVFVYYIFEPFLHCILWALLLDTLLFPLKNHSTIWARSFLEHRGIRLLSAFHELIKSDSPPLATDAAFTCTPAASNYSGFVINIYWMPILIFYLFGVLTYSRQSRLIQIS